MIITFLLSFIVGALNIFFDWLPSITALPNINGFDIDGALSNGMGQLNSVMQSMWVLSDVFIAFLFVMSYYGLMMIVRFFLGSRTPRG